ncbi:RidA family protein [Rheinheimera sp.]|uniref:RidA family protein n=1 Tax=Rheinheimera sp. TaxID=1869214 RepID=UPI0027BAC8FF|nr:RidA family protein [Rheinheimera sp.]
MLSSFKILMFLLILFFVSGCASTAAFVERKNYFPWENDVGYSQVVKHGNILYISGIPSEKATFDEQVDDIYTQIKKILADYDVGTEAIVKEVIFTTDIEALKTAIPARKVHFNGKYPAASWVEVKRLWSKSNLLEVEVIVALP